jgi:uncharacterized membrane protein
MIREQIEEYGLLTVLRWLGVDAAALLWGLYAVFGQSAVEAINPTVALALHATFGLLGFIGLAMTFGLHKYIRVET